MTSQALGLEYRNDHIGIGQTILGGLDDLALIFILVFVFVFLLRKQFQLHEEIIHRVSPVNFFSANMGSVAQSSHRSDQENSINWAMSAISGTPELGKIGQAKNTRKDYPSPHVIFPGLTLVSIQIHADVSRNTGKYRRDHAQEKSQAGLGLETPEREPSENL